MVNICIVVLIINKFENNFLFNSGFYKREIYVLISSFYRIFGIRVKWDDVISRLLLNGYECGLCYLFRGLFGVWGLVYSLGKLIFFKFRRFFEDY